MRSMHVWLAAPRAVFYALWFPAVEAQMETIRAELGSPYRMFS